MDVTLKWTKRLFLLAIGLIFIAFLTLGGGHGSYIIAILLFPFGFIGILYSRWIEVPYIILGLIQYPIYGLLIDSFRYRKGYKWILLSIISIHLILAVSILILRGENFK